MKARKARKREWTLKKGSETIQRTKNNQMFKQKNKRLRQMQEYKGRSKMEY